MKRGTQEEMIERRREMLSLNRSGMKPNEWIPLVASNHGISEDAVKKDWNKRGCWKRSLIDLKNCSDLIRGCILDIEKYSIQLETFVKNTKDESCKLGAIKQLIENRFKLIKFYHSYDNEELRERVKKLEKMAERGVFIA